MIWILNLGSLVFLRSVDLAAGGELDHGKQKKFCCLEFSCINGILNVKAVPLIVFGNVGR